MNNLNLTHTELDNLVKSNDLEEFSTSQFGSFLTSNEELLIKGERGDLEDFEKSEYQEIFDEIRSFTSVDVYIKNKDSNRIEKSVVFIRRKQVEWEPIEKSEDGEIMKARSGTYTNTPENKKLGRVGAKYGSKKEPEGKSEKKEETGSDSKLWDSLSEENKHGVLEDLGLPKSDSKKKHSEFPEATQKRMKGALNSYRSSEDKKEEGKGAIGSKLESSKTPVSFWNKLDKEEKVKVLKDSGIMKNLWHQYTNIHSPGSKDSSGRPDYSSNIGMAELNVNEYKFNEFGKSFKRDFKEYFEAKKR